MTDHRDTELLQLFSNNRRPLDSEIFAARVTWRIELEQKERAWQKVIWMVVALCIAAFASVWVVQGLTFLASELTMGLRATSNDQVSQWLTTALFSLATIGFATLWRLLRSDR